MPCVLLQRKRVEFQKSSSEIQQLLLKLGFICDNDDPVGNITQIDDNAQQTIYFNGSVVSPSQKFEYDALYRLLKSTGREHVSINASSEPEAEGYNPAQISPQDGSAMRNYTREWQYDSVGNILSLIHNANGNAWTRSYDYASDSNRLNSTTVGQTTVNYTYNAHGSMTSMAHLQGMQWDFAEKLSHITRGTTEAYYNYDGGGIRTRKVVEKNGVTETRLYLGGFEIWRKTVNGVLNTERETLHVMDDSTRVAVVETLTVDNSSAVANPVPVLRYQLDNHLGSASLELDDLANVISYEEYYPYGDTSYRAGRTASEVSQKRYRYTGKEKDEESGLYYHGARYYACWLGRWTAADPIGLVDGVNLYMYVRGNPVRLSDPSGNAGEEEISIGGLIEKGKQYIEEKYNESISSSIEYVQTEINQIQEKAKNSEDLSFSEKASLRGVYRSFIIGGKFKGMPEASELLSHYLGGEGDPVDAPYELDSEVYETSAIVQYAMEKMTEHVKELHAKGKNVEGNYRSSEILKPTPNRDSDTEGRVLGKKDGYALISEQSNARLKYADHRFHLNLNVNLAENGKGLELTWSVKSKWDYEPYSDEKSNSAHVTEIPWNKEKNQVLKLDDGLSQHLTKIGMAKVFWHEAKWKTKLEFKK